MATAIFRDDVRSNLLVHCHNRSRPSRYSASDRGELYCGDNGMLAFDPIPVEWEGNVGYLNWEEDLSDEQIDFLKEAGLRLLTY